MMMSRYCRAISGDDFWCVIPLIVLVALLPAFMMILSAGVCCWHDAVLNADAICCSILFGSGKLSSVLDIRRRSAMLHPVVVVGPPPARDFTSSVCGSTVCHLLGGIGVHLGFVLGSFRS